jgi:hypothetical protein
VRRADNPIVLKYESLKLLEPSGPVQACNWISVPLTYKEALLRVPGQENLTQDTYMGHNFLVLASEGFRTSAGTFFCSLRSQHILRGRAKCKFASSNCDKKYVPISREEGLSLEADDRSASQTFPCLSWNPKFNFRVHKSQLLVPILSQIYLVRSLH